MRRLAPNVGNVTSKAFQWNTASCLQIWIPRSQSWRDPVKWPMHWTLRLFPAARIVYKCIQYHAMPFQDIEIKHDNKANQILSWARQTSKQRKNIDQLHKCRSFFFLSSAIQRSLPDVTTPLLMFHPVFLLRGKSLLAVPSAWTSTDVQSCCRTWFLRPTSSAK